MPGWLPEGWDSVLDMRDDLLANSDFLESVARQVGVEPERLKELLDKNVPPEQQKPQPPSTL